MSPLRALARVNVAAIERNVGRLRRELRAGTELCAVVKADGYGHGALPAARAALAGGATWLAVATANEAAHLRATGVDGPLLVLGALSPEELDVALSARADVVAWREAFVEAVAARGGGRVHVKLDTGMGRLGTRDSDEATRVAQAAAARAPVELVGAMTHFATADERDDDFFGEQLARFDAWALPLRERHPGLILHAANSAGLLRDAASHYDLVRPGVAIYGLDPFQEDAASPRPRAGTGARQLRRRDQALRARRERRLRPALRRRRGHGDRHGADRLRRRGQPRADQQRRAAGRRAALPAGRHGVDGQRHPGPRRRRRAACRSATRPS